MSTVGQSSLQGGADWNSIISAHTKNNSDLAAPSSGSRGGHGGKKRNQKLFEFPDISDLRDLNFKGFPIPAIKKSVFWNGPHQFQYLKLIDQR